MIARNMQNVLRHFRDYRVGVLTGARQTGKTTLLRSTFPEFQYITLDDPAVAMSAAHNPRSFLESLKLPAVIDEIQYAPELFRAIKPFVDEKKQKGMLFLTGSQGFDLMQGVAESLAGRAVLFSLDTFSLAELSAHRKFGSGQKLAQLHMVRGGYPALYENPEMEKNIWYSSYMGTYLERDVRNIAGVGDLVKFRNFLRSAALRSGQLLNYSDLARDTGISPNTARGWMSVLQTSGIVELLQPWHSNAQKRLVKSPKLYFLDSGLLCYLLEIDDWNELRTSPHNGHVFETWVYGQLHRLRALSPSPFRINFWQNKNGKEIDFILSRGSRHTGLEVKFRENPDKNDAANFAWFEKEGKPFDRRIIIGWNSREYPLDKKTSVLPAWEIGQADGLLK